MIDTAQLRKEFKPVANSQFDRLLSRYESERVLADEALAAWKPVAEKWTALRLIATNRRPPFVSQREAERAGDEANALFDDYSTLKKTAEFHAARASQLETRISNTVLLLRRAREDAEQFGKEAKGLQPGKLIKITGEGQYSPHAEFAAANQRLDDYLQKSTQKGGY